MNYTSARSTIVTFFDATFKAAYPTVPVFYENTVEVDLDLQPDIFIMFNVDFLDNLRQNVDSVPITEVYGEVAMRIYTRAGKGTAAGLSLFDYLTTLLSHKDLTGGITTKTAAPDRKATQVGWLMTDLVVPFCYFV